MNKLEAKYELIDLFFEKCPICGNPIVPSLGMPLDFATSSEEGWTTVIKKEHVHARCLYRFIDCPPLLQG